jgi:hypothetical protein
MICLKNRLRSETLLYELTYRAKDPLVLGIGLAAIRDVVLFFQVRNEGRRRHPNPVAGAMKWSIGHGTSQSGNALKTFLLQGFNEDERSGSCSTGATRTSRAA